MKASHMMWLRMQQGDATRDEWLLTVEREHKNFKVSNTPPRGTRQTQRTPATADPPDKKETAQ